MFAADCITFVCYFRNLGITYLLQLKAICAVCSAMHIAWRERNKSARIKAAKEILEKNPEYVALLFFIYTNWCF